MLGALLAARREAGTGAINPLYGLQNAPFSDAFLVLTVALLISLVATMWLPTGKETA